MRPGFMSSVCPQQTLPELIATAQRHGYEGIEFRVEWNHAHGIELTASAQALAEARRLLAEHGVAASCIATSVKLNSADASEHARQREALRHTIALASEVGAPCVRTFADSLPEEDVAAREKVIAMAAESYASVNDWAVGHGVTVLVETHTNMRAHWARQILDAAQASALGVLWHIGHHTQRGQTVDDAYRFIRGRVHHVHFTASQDDPHVTDADNRRMVALLAADGFAGFLSVEIINPADPEAVLRHHIAKYRAFQ